MKEKTTVSDVNNNFISDTNIGERFKKLREDYSLSQTQFANELSLNPSSISQIESNRIKPSIDTLMIVYQKFKVNLHWLLTGKDKPVEYNNKNTEQDSLSQTLHDLNRNLNEIIKISDTNSIIKEVIELKNYIVSNTNNPCCSLDLKKITSRLIDTQAELIECQKELLEIYRKKSLS